MTISWVFFPCIWVLGVLIISLGIKGALDWWWVSIMIFWPIMLPIMGIIRALFLLSEFRLKKSCTRKKSITQTTTLRQHR